MAISGGMMILKAVGVFGDSDSEEVPEVAVGPTSASLTWSF